MCRRFNCLNDLSFLKKKRNRLNRDYISSSGKKWKWIRLHTMKRFLGNRNQIWRSRTIGVRMTHNVSVVHHHLIMSYLQHYVIQYRGILRLFRNLGKMSWPLVLISYMSYIERCGYINLAVVIIWTFVIYLEGRT